MPWSKNDNPNGWVEITTYCNMSCPGCYRGCDREDNKKEHKSFEEIKREILLLKKIRNCHTITISGGEPLLHPEIFKIINFIRSQKMNSFMFTNGKLLTRDKALELKKAGLVGLTIRVDPLRETKQGLEEELNNLRKMYANIIYGLNLYLGFTYVISKKNILKVPSFLEWCQKNNNKIDLIILILFRQVFFEKGEKRISKENFISLQELLEVINKEREIFPSAFLGSDSKDFEIRWLYSFSLSLDGKLLGYTDKKFIELMQVLNHFFHGRYFYILNKKEHYFPFYKLLFFAIINKSMRKIFGNYLKELLKNPTKIFKRAHLQIIDIVQPPSFVDGKRDLCDSCPDATFYKGRLVPSCLLEEIKKFGSLYKLKKE